MTLRPRLLAVGERIEHSRNFQPMTSIRAVAGLGFPLGDAEPETAAKTMNASERRIKNSWA
jgi:hypothetical protein